MQELFELAGGLYWPLDVALETDVNYIQIAASARNEFFNTLLGGGSKEENTAPSKPALDARGREITLSPNVFDVQFDIGKRQIRRK